MGKIISPNEPLQLTWVEFLVHFMRKYCAAQMILELENQFLNLKRGSLTVEEYTDAFTDNMEFALCIVPEKLNKIDRYNKGLPQEYIVPVKQSPTFEAGVWAEKVVENMVKVRTADNTKVREKGNLMDLLEIKRVKGRRITFQIPTPKINPEVTRRQGGVKDVR